MFIIFMVEGSGYFHGVAAVSRQAPSDLLNEFRDSSLTTAYFITWLRRSVLIRLSTFQRMAEFLGTLPEFLLQ